MTGSRIVCVLGPSRSRTSLTTGILKRLGVFLGPEERLPEPQPYNPKGTLEHRQIHDLNQEILRMMGGSFDSPPALPAGWELSNSLKLRLEEARRIVVDDFGASDFWVWKDPRTCLTLPFWKRVVRPTHYVLCVRNPLDTALSISSQRFLGCSFEKGLFLWVHYLESAFRLTATDNRHIVDCDNLAGDWREEVDALCRFLGLPVPEAESSQYRVIADFIDERLLHDRIAPLQAASVVHDRLGSGGRLSEQDVQVVREAAALITSASSRAEARIQEARRKKWFADRSEVAAQLLQNTTPGSRIVLAESSEWAGQALAGRDVIPFLEHDGVDFGPPPDEVTATRKLERLRASGTDYVAFWWPSFWWLEAFPGLNRLLRHEGRCIVQNELLILFDVHSSQESQIVSVM